MQLKKRVLPVPLAVALALAPACPALAGSSKGKAPSSKGGGKAQPSSKGGKQPQAAAHGAGRKVH